MTERSDVLVIGGGVIGVSLTLELARRGAAVTLVDRGAIGRGSSYGNAGWLTPSLANPLPAPGMLRDALRWLTDPESPLYVKPAPSAALVEWLWGFLRKMNRRDYERGTEALLPLSTYSLDVFKALDAESPGAFSFEQRGLLVVAESDAGFDAAVLHAGRMARRGREGRTLDADAVRSLEPAVKGPIRGGVFLPGEAHAEPFAVVEAMAAAAERAGARFRPGLEVYDFDAVGGEITAVRTTTGLLRAGQYVLATGAWSKALARRLNLRLPVLGGKGYAVTVRGFPAAPRIPIKSIERRIAITPRADSVRLAGTLELVDGDESIAPRRVAAILSGSRALLDMPADPEILEVWRGLRPCTPDGLPVIGWSPLHRNLLIATGHQMLGLHSAPGSARLAADLLAGATPIFDPVPFRADRF